MVCKRSLYCWKNGPCASEQTRKQIWEDNIRFRESLRNLNQSDHYWSFQISKNLCLCLEGDFLCSRPLFKKYRSASLQRLHEIDCASVTHDSNDLKFRNCFIHCPIHVHEKSSENKRADSPIPQTLAQQPLTISKLPLSFTHIEKPKFCHRYKNTLTSAFKPELKTKCSSQSNLNSVSDKSSLRKKCYYASCENLNSTRKLLVGKKVDYVEAEKLQPSKNKNENVQSKTQKEVNIKSKKLEKELNPIMNACIQGKIRNYTPVSRTTRKMLYDNKKVPFVTYGCNNKNLDIGSKRTHNVFASKVEVYPNALSAKEHKRNWILKYIQSEKEFQKKSLPEEIRKKIINHSSLWSSDNYHIEDKLSQKKNSKYVFPLMTKPPKKLTVNSKHFDSNDARSAAKMESPQASKRKVHDGCDSSLLKINCTPQHKKTVLCEEQFSLYQLHKESSPNFRAGQDVLEVGWGDSPEPLNMEPKHDINKTPVTSKKKLEIKESPKSSIPVKRRNVRSTFSLSSKNSVDVSKYVAEVEELSKNIMKEFKAQNSNKNSVADAKIIETRNRLSPVPNSLKRKSSESAHIECHNHKTDPAFDSLLETFINEEDDWLSQALSSQEVRKIPHKNNFVKSKSENELTLHQSSDSGIKSFTQNCRTINNNMRRTSSFNMSTTLDDLNKNKGKTCNRYSLQEIEKKRLEAKYRKERKEIEKKKLEALRKLEMKKLRAIKT